MNEVKNVRPASGQAGRAQQPGGRSRNHRVPRTRPEREFFAMALLMAYIAGGLAGAMVGAICAGYWYM